VSAVLGNKRKIKTYLRDAIERERAARERVRQASDRYIKHLKRTIERTPSRRNGRDSTRPDSYDSWFDSDFRRATKRKEGRPSIWLGSKGYRLVCAVDEIRAADERCTISKAIRKAVRTDMLLKDSKEVRRLSDRALQARYQQAWDYWADALAHKLKEAVEHEREYHAMERGAVSAYASMLAILEEKGVDEF
jgi:hypothetical protein